MKNVLIFTNILFLGAAVFFWSRLSAKKKELVNCQKLIAQSPNPPPVVEPNKIPPIDTSVQVCIGCTQETEGEDVNHLKVVLENYREKIWDVINGTRMNQSTNSLIFDNTVSMGKAGINYSNTDARCIWFSLETLKQFICTIEKNNAKLTNYATNLGIRFYYAVYEPDYNPDLGKANRHTLFMVPTRSNGNEPAVDFDPRETLFRQTNIEDYGKTYLDQSVTFNALITERFRARKALILTEAEPAINKPSTNLVKQNGMPTFSKNNGELCPTHCPIPNTLDVIDP
jgi:hypothetical protein